MQLTAHWRRRAFSTSQLEAARSAPNLQSLADQVCGAFEVVEARADGSRAFHFEALSPVDLGTYRSNNTVTAKWLHDVIESKCGLVYVGFEAFFDTRFSSFASFAASHGTPLAFSPLVKSSQEFVRDRKLYEAMETADEASWDATVVVHLGSSHVMDRLLFGEDAAGHLQRAWRDGRLALFSPELAVTGNCCFRAGLSHVLRALGCGADSPTLSIEACDFTALDKDIASAKRRVDEARTFEDVFVELFRTLATYVERRQLDAPCWWDSGWEAFHLWRAVSKALAEDDLRVPMTRAALVNARNSAIGDALHAFYATPPSSFPVVVSGDTAGLLAGGISMINIHTRNRFGVVVILNNRGMAIEDVISKRSVDGHQYSYDYVKLDKKRDIFTVDQLKDAVKSDVLGVLRDHCWGVSPHRAEAIVLNIDVQSLRRNNANASASDAALTGRSFLDDDFGARFVHLSEPRRRLERIIDVLHDEVNLERRSPRSRPVPIKIQGCSAIEFMEVFSQLSITMRDKLVFIPTPTDLLATRTLIPSLVASDSTRSSPDTLPRNANGSFACFVSNAVFGVDGLNNLISTHLEYGTGTLVHLAYDAADIVTHYALIGQVHRNFGVRPASVLPSLYRNHQAYEGQVITLAAFDEQAPECIRQGLRDPEVKVILVDMGAPNLTEFLES